MDMLIILLLTLMSRSNAYNCFTLPYPQTQYKYQAYIIFQLFASPTAQSIPLSTDYIKGQSLDFDSVGNIVYGIETTDPAVHGYTSGIIIQTYYILQSLFMDTWGLKKWAKSYGLGDQYIKKVAFNPQGTKIAALASYNGLGSGERAETFLYTMEASGGSAINQYFIAINNYEATDYNVRDTMLYDSMGNIIVGFFSKFNPPNWLQRYKLIKFTDSLTPSIYIICLIMRVCLQTLFLEKEEEHLGRQNQSPKTPKTLLQGKHGPHHVTIFRQCDYNVPSGFCLRVFNSFLID